MLQVCPSPSHLLHPSSTSPSHPTQPMNLSLKMSAGLLQKSILFSSHRLEGSYFGAHGRRGCQISDPATVPCLQRPTDRRTPARTTPHCGRERRGTVGTQKLPVYRHRALKEAVIEEVYPPSITLEAVHSKVPEHLRCTRFVHLLISGTKLGRLTIPVEVSEEKECEFVSLVCGTYSLRINGCRQP